MFRDDDYKNPGDEPYASVDVSRDGCEWAGCLYERKAAGFDLFYFHENSSFKTLDLNTITQLRHESQAADGLLFVARIPDARSHNELIKEAERLLLAWVATKVGPHRAGA